MTFRRGQLTAWETKSTSWHHFSLFWIGMVTIAASFTVCTKLNTILTVLLLITALMTMIAMSLLKANFGPNRCPVINSGSLYLAETGWSQLACFSTGILRLCEVLDTVCHQPYTPCIAWYHQGRHYSQGILSHSLSWLSPEWQSPGAFLSPWTCLWSALWQPPLDAPGPTEQHQSHPCIPHYDFESSAAWNAAYSMDISFQDLVSHKYAWHYWHI